VLTFNKLKALDKQRFSYQGIEVAEISGIMPGDNGRKILGRLPKNGVLSPYMEPTGASLRHWSHGGVLVY
jgi:hypothetical protein